MPCPCIGRSGGNCWCSTPRVRKERSIRHCSPFPRGVERKEKEENVFVTLYAGRNEFLFASHLSCFAHHPLFVFVPIIVHELHSIDQTAEAETKKCGQHISVRLVTRRTHALRSIQWPCHRKTGKIPFWCANSTFCLVSAEP